MKTYIITLLSIGFFALGYSQNSISGQISDLENNPLLGVDIYAPELHIGTTSDVNGNYELNNLPKGEIRIVFSMVGFETVTKLIPLNSETTQLNIQLNEAVFNIDEVIISTPFNKLQSDNVMKVEFAKIKTLRQKGAPTLIEGLETIPGVSQISTGTSIGKPVIRGLSGNRVLVYTQGVRLENQQFGDEHGLGVNQSGIESVEVIKGPASLLYGSDALGGVLYFNPEKFAPSNTLKSDFSQQYFSNTQGSSSSFGLKQSYEKFKFLVRGSYDSHLDYKIPDDLRVTNTRYNEVDFNSGIGFNNKLITSELRYNYNRSEIGITEGIEAQNKHKVPNLPYQQIDNHILSLHNHIFFQNSKLDIDLGYTFNNRKEFEDEHGHDEDEDHDEDEHEEEHDEHHDVEPALDMHLKNLTYNAKYHFPKMNRFELIIGVQGLIQNNKNFGEEILIPNADIKDFGVLATSVVEWENNSLQGGIRFDNRDITTERHEIEHEHEHEDEDEHEEEDGEIHVFEAIDKKYNSFTASLGYKTELSEHITARLNVATGFRAPNLAELTSNGVHHGTNRFEIGNANLKNEQNLQTDISFEYENKHFEFYINGFYNQLNDYIFISPTGEIEDDAPVFMYTQEDAKLYGGEIGLHIHPHPLDWLHIESSFETVIGKQDSDKYLPLIPANKWNNTVRTEFDIANWLKNGFTAITITNTFKQENISDFETPSDSYTLVNLGIGGKIHLNKISFEMNVNANNLFDTSYISHLSRLKSDNINNIGRNIIVGLNFNI
ncbi:TonB-dependent receptor [Urechidicola croceus]|uniref:TonB-dependent receptor n=1 Tax=Urechidicola croceus TaxID=1850246 RepID=A0A1D8P604_9FLAO|nr:TonB-dependent receptor [Urechidicola croceus]AOW20004.1 TonB-dependent receptor [Urechidicola croceus]